MRDHFCTPKALLEALKKSTVEGEDNAELGVIINELKGKKPTKTGAKKKELGTLEEKIYENQKKALKRYEKPVKETMPEIAAQKERMKPVNKDLRNIFTDNYLRVSKSDAELNGKQALIEAYKKGKFTDAEAEQLATNQHAINMRRITVNDARLNAQVKQFNKFLEEKKVDKRARQTVLDKLLMVARQSEDGTLDNEAFGKLAKKVLKDQLTVSDAGVPNYVEIELRKLSKKIDEVNASDKRADIKHDEILALRGQINAQLSSLIKPNMGDKFNMPLFVEPLLNMGSAVGDVLGSANAVASHAYLNGMTRFLMKFDPKDPKASLATLGKELKSIDLGKEATNTGKAISKLTTGFVNNVAFALDAGFHPIKACQKWVEARDTGTLWKPIQYALEGHVPLGHDDTSSGKLRPAFAYENKGFEEPWKRLGRGLKNKKLGEISGSLADLVETTVHHYEILGNIRLNATDMPFLDYVYRNRIAEVISDGLKQDPNFKLTEEDVKNAHAFTNWLLFKNDNVVSENIKSLRDFFNFKLDLGGNKLTIPIGSIIQRYTRTPTNVALRSLDVQGLADIRFLFGYIGKGLNKNKEEWVKQVREKYDDNIANKLDTGIDVVSKLLNAGITKYELKKGKNGVAYVEAQLDEKTNKPILIADKQHDFEMVQGIVKLATTGGLGVAIYALAQNTDVFSTGYDKKTSDVQEAEETRNDFYYNSTALLRLTFGGNGKNQKGDTLIPLSKILGQHLFGAKTAVRLSKGEELNGDEANAVSDFFEASQNQFGDGTGLFNLAKAVKAPLESITERLPKVPFTGSVGRDIATVIDDKERVTKTDSTLGTAWNQYLSGTAFRNSLPVKTDITGETPKSNGFGKFLGIPKKLAKANPILRELAKISKESGEDVQLKQVDNSFEIGKELAFKFRDYGIEPQTMKLNASDYAKWQEIHNKTVYEAVKKRINTDGFNELPVKIKVSQIKSAVDNASKIIDGYNLPPKEEFLLWKLKKQ